jgi:hypothetical protein
MYKILVLCLVVLCCCNKNIPINQVQNNFRNFEQEFMYAEAGTDKQIEKQSENNIIDINELINLNYKKIKDVVFGMKIFKKVYIYFF